MASTTHTQSVQNGSTSTVGTGGGTGTIEGLHTLRAMAIVLVFAYHYMVFVSHVPTFGCVSTVGWTGVDLFFVLSGYLIANQIIVGVRKGKKLSLPAFYGRRLLRTLPNYYAVLGLYLLFPIAMGGGTLPPVWKFLTFTQNYHLQPGTAFSHAWSLCVEEQFYLMLPIGAVLITRAKSPVRMAWCVLCVLTAAGIATRCALWHKYGPEADGGATEYYRNIYYATVCRADEFLPGVAVALLKNCHCGTWDRLMNRGQILLATGLGCTAVMFYLLLRFYEIEDYGYGFAMTGYGYTLMAIAFAILVAAAQSKRCSLHRMKIPGAARLAELSYAIYLTHKPVSIMMQQQLLKHGITASTAVGILLISSTCLAAGWLLNTTVETPFMRLRNKYIPGNFAASTASK
jgi:peptidoglycan/LPS O-acetylase OafA/YrhL